MLDSRHTLLNFTEVYEEEVTLRNVVDDLVTSGKSELEAFEALEQLIQNNKLFPISDSALLKLRTHESITPFEQRRQQLQVSFLEMKRNGVSYTVLKDEQLELQESEKIMILDDEEEVTETEDYNSDGLRGRRKKKQEKKSR